MKKITLLFLALSLSTFTAKVFAQNALDVGMSLLDKKDCAGALPYLKRAINDNPKSEKANLYLGSAYLCLGNLDSAEIFLRFAVRYDDKSAPAYFGLGQVYLKQKKDVEALENLKTATTLDPKDGKYQVALGYAYLENDSTDAAMKAFYRATDLNDKNVQAIEGIGDVYFKQNILEAAIENYNHALQLDSSNVPLMLKLANTYMKNNDGGKAYEMFVKVSQLAPNNADAQYQAGELLYTNKRYRDAFPFLQKYHQLKPNDDKTLLDLAKSAYEGHLYSDAVTYYQEYLKKYPGSIMAKASIAASYFFESKPVQSYNIFKSIPIDSMDVKDLARFGLAADAVHDTASTISAWSRAVKMDTSLDVIENRLAGVFFSARRYDEAIAHFKRYLTMKPNDYAAMLNMGLCYVASRNFGDAIIILKKVLTGIPDNYQAALWLARTYSFADSLEQAANAYDNVITLALKDTSKTDHSSDLNEAYRVKATYKIISGSRLSKNNPDEATKLYQSANQDLMNAVKYDPKDYKTHALLAQDYALMGKMGEACKEIKIVLRTASRDDPTYNQMLQLQKSLSCE